MNSNVASVTTAPHPRKKKPLSKAMTRALLALRQGNLSRPRHQWEWSTCRGEPVALVVVVNLVKRGYATQRQEADRLIVQITASGTRVAEKLSNAP